MTFTYTISTTPTDLTKVRYHTGDTDSATAMWTDEEIAMVLAMESTVGGAVISLIKSAIIKLTNEPDMQADWLKIDWRRSSDAWFKLLDDKKQEFGLGWQSGDSAQHSYRPDTLQKESPDYGETD